MSTSPRTLREWLALRVPTPPPALREGLHDALGEDLDAPVTDLPGRLLRAGETSLAALLALDTVPREAALQLLVADALVTYAFEAAAESSVELDTFADAAMLRLSGHGAGAGVAR